ncbi:cocosin 1-like [Typha latifolia]|uniref:cocosin 1-like n=1 Tax=Typha latifolia TaxID=4733 RepID=UPI003C2EBFB4
MTRVTKYSPSDLNKHSTYIQTDVPFPSYKYPPSTSLTPHTGSNSSPYIIAMATYSSLLSFSLCFLLLCHGSLAQLWGQARTPWQSQRRFGGQRGQCRFERLDALEPLSRVQSEAGVTEHFDENHEQFRCAGVFIRRRIIEPRGLLLPSYSNAPRLVYILQGRGITASVFPGCPETYQSFQHQYETGSQQSERFRDEHQKIQRFRQGDIIALPAGVVNWCYNDGDSPVIAVTVFDTSNNANQLDPRHREFLLAGRHQRGQQSIEGQREYEERTGNNVLSGFDVQLLAESLGVSREVAQKLQSQNDQRGEIVRVRQGLHLLRPTIREGREREEEEEEEVGGQYPQEQREGCREQQSNGLDETFCNLRSRENINDPSKADIYTPRGGRITRLNSQKLPILNLVQMSAVRVVLYRNAIITPYWNINAHSIMYVTHGCGRVQVVGSRGNTVFDGELRPGQVLVIPQNYAVLKRAERERFEWVSFKTNSNAMVSQISGKSSSLRGLPVDVLTNSYRLSREEARRLKFSRGNEMVIFAPRSEMRSQPQPE